MATKTISIMDDAYHILAEKKRKSESFSEVIRRITKGKRDIMELAGAWKNIPNKEIEGMKKTIRKLREESTKELMENIKK